MIIRNIRHKALKRLLLDGNSSGLSADAVPKLRRILSFLTQISHEDELRLVPSWKTHQLTGDREGVWSMHVTRNWRITFAIDQAAIEIIDLDYEDYH